MLSSAMTRGLFDELRKIADISTSGLSPETVLNAPRPEPMPTPGLDKARAILSKAEMFKTAAKKKRQSKPLVDGYKLPTVGEQSKKNVWDQAKSVAGHGLAGAAAGKTLAELSKANITNVGKWRGAAAGAAVGLGDYAYQKIRQKRQPELPVKTAAFTPGMALKASKQVGTVSGSLNKGLKAKVPTIGNKGTLPKP
jgi:hypothetical protein